VSVDAVFMRQLWAVLRLVFRHWRSKEVFIVLVHSSFLMLRTLLSVAVARLDGRIVRDLVSADGKGFIRGLGLWFALAIPSTYTNSMVGPLANIGTYDCSPTCFLDTSSTIQVIFAPSHSTHSLHS
jgi:hypothetical protein